MKRDSLRSYVITSFTKLKVKNVEASRAGRARWLKKQKQLEIKFQREERNQFRKKKKTNKRNNRLAKS